MKDICVGNFNHSNIKAWIGECTHRQKVEFAVHCAELVVDLYSGNSDAPKKAIEAAKDWILDPSEENKKKCKDAAYAAYADAAGAADAALIAAYAADAAGAADATLITSYAAGAAYAAYAAYADAAGAADADAAKKSIKEKIVNYLLGKEKQPRTKEVYEKVNCNDLLFWECAKEYQSKMHIYCKDSKGKYVIQDLEQLVQQYKTGVIYRKVEKPIEWWEDIDSYIKAMSCITIDASIGSTCKYYKEENTLSISATMTHEQWCDFARILLEQEE